MTLKEFIEPIEFDRTVVCVRHKTEKGFADKLLFYWTDEKKVKDFLDMEIDGIWLETVADDNGQYNAIVVYI